MTATDMGMALLPAVQSFLTAMTPLVQKLGLAVQWFSGLPEPIRNTAMGFVAISIAIGPVLQGSSFLIKAFSGLLGLFRLFPTLKLGMLFSDIAVYMGGAIKGAWSLTAAMGALATSFTPFLAAGAIALSLWGIVKIFQRMNDEARLAGMTITNMKDIGDVEERIKEIKTRRQYHQEEYKSADAMIMISDRSREQIRSGAQQKLMEDDIELAKLLVQLEALKNPKIPDTIKPDYSATEGATAGDFSAKWGEMFDVEKFNQRNQELNDAFFARMESMAKGVGPVASGGRAEVNLFTKGLTAVSSALGNFTGPLQEAVAPLKGMIDSISTLPDMFESFKNISFQKSDSNPLGVLGGIMGTIGAIGGIVGTVAGVFDMLTGASARQKAAAEELQRAAEAWMKFLAEASVSQLFGKQTEVQTNLATEKAALEKQIEDAKNRIANIASEDLGSSTTQVITEINAEMAKAQARLAEIGPAAAKQIADINNQLRETLGITTNALLGVLRSAFSEVDLTSFKTKFYDSFHETVRNAVINGFMDAELVKPMSDMLATAFNSPFMKNGINVFISPEEMAQIKAMQDTLYGKASVMYGVMDGMGLGMKEVTDATNKATESMLNVPEGLKVARYRFAASDAYQIPQMATGGYVPSRSGGTPVNLGEGGEGEYVIPESKMGSRTPIVVEAHFYIDGSELHGIMKRYKQRDNILSGGTMSNQAPQYV